MQPLTFKTIIFLVTFASVSIWLQHCDCKFLKYIKYWSLQPLPFQTMTCPATFATAASVPRDCSRNTNKRSVTSAARFAIRVSRACTPWSTTKSHWTTGPKMTETPTRAIPAATTAMTTEKRWRHLPRKRTSPNNPRRWKGCCRCFCISRRDIGVFDSKETKKKEILTYGCSIKTNANMLFKCIIYRILSAGRSKLKFYITSEGLILTILYPYVRKNANDSAPSLK